MRGITGEGTLLFSELHWQNTEEKKNKKTKKPERSVQICVDVLTEVIIWALFYASARMKIQTEGNNPIHILEMTVFYLYNAMPYVVLFVDCFFPFLMFYLFIYFAIQFIFTGLISLVNFRKIVIHQANQRVDLFIPNGKRKEEKCKIKDNISTEKKDEKLFTLAMKTGITGWWYRWRWHLTGNFSNNKAWKISANVPV